MYLNFVFQKFCIAKYVCITHVILAPPGGEADLVVSVLVTAFNWAIVTFAIKS